MLDWASRSYAMSDGHPEAPTFAKAIAEPCEADGVAKIIEQLSGSARLNPAPIFST